MNVSHNLTTHGTIWLSLEDMIRFQFLPECIIIIESMFKFLHSIIFHIFYLNLWSSVICHCVTLLVECEKFSVEVGDEFIRKQTVRLIADTRSL